MKINLTGTARDGKTVFLSSLLWQLAESESADFRLGDGLRLSGFRELNGRGNLEETFPFDHYRDSLSRSRLWPKKTTDCYRYACEVSWVYRKRPLMKKLGRLCHFKFSNQQKLEFYDFPGERVADAAIAAIEDYGQWSDRLLRHFESHSDYLAAVSPYLDLQKRLVDGDHQEPSQMADRVVHAYKLALAGLVHGYKPLISPSTFMLDRQGSVAKPATDEELAATRLAGVTEDSQFAPLTKEMRTAFPALAKLMAAHYRDYRRTVSLPLFKEIGQAERLIVLVDIPSILAGGVGRYNDCRQIVLDLFEALRPDSSIGALLARSLTFWRGRLKKVAFVATKADLVHPDDIRNGRLKSLLRQMTVQAKHRLPGVEFEWFACSAIHSTRAGSATGKLIGRLMADNPERKEMEYSVSSLPESWPADWKPRDYQFASVCPEVPGNLQIPPKHLGMDRILDFLIGDRI